MTAATRALTQNPKLSTGAGEERQSQEEEVDNPLAPHISHDIRQMATYAFEAQEAMRAIETWEPLHSTSASVRRRAV